MKKTDQLQALDALPWKELLVRSDTGTKYAGLDMF
jgi:hypothetical protein